MVLRICHADMSSHGGFIWPKSGRVTASDWKANQTCGNGLHGWFEGQGEQDADGWFEEADVPSILTDIHREGGYEEVLPNGDVVVYCRTVR